MATHPILTEEDAARQPRTAAARPGYLLVVPWDVLPGTGVNEVVRNLYRELEAAGAYEPAILVNSATPPGEAERAGSGYRIVRARLPLAWTPRFPLAPLVFAAKLLPTLVRLRRLVRERRVAVVNPHFPALEALTFVLMKWLRLYRGALVLSFHGADVAELRRSAGLERRLWRLLLRSADRVVTCSEWLRGELLAFAPALAARTHAVHNGVDLRLFENLPRDAAPGRLVLCVAAFEHKKAHDILLRAFAMLAREEPGCRLRLIGGRAAALPEIEARIAAEGMSGNIEVLVGVPHDRIPSHMAQAAVFVLPSRVEPFGIVLIEAGAAGVPIVATAVGGVPEILRDGETGRLVPPEDPAALAAAILDTLRRPEEAAARARRFQQEVRRRFTWQRCGQAYRALL